jgi:hypothetical protein
MTPMILRDLSSRDASSPETFADRLAEAIAELMAKSVSGATPLEPQPQTLEQLIAVAIHKELPR